MKNLKFLLLGIFFGIVLAKAQVISWFRIYEMFRFESFHMYGIIGSAVIIGALIVQYIKRSKLKSIDGTLVTIDPKPKTYKASIFGGIIFGLGWALVGACPGSDLHFNRCRFLEFHSCIIWCIAGHFYLWCVKRKTAH
jgi:uncharacterized membrane protein YedE/YeeE